MWPACRGAACLTRIQRYCDFCTKKRRVTLNLDEDVVEALEANGSRSMSSVANGALREVEVAAHRTALRKWLDEKHGAPSPEQLAAAQTLLTADPGDIAALAV